ncbi:MAG: hypothetical protein HOG03_00495 [Desulfobacula sp.]|nr:hypothetical protein [Desulfobacula sp.]MBT3483868.1 hypothetical protein [Desulfobacula sp.]MBT3803056.1 hypothetical protein [Desulfobacula sp.]MBT4023431.1 hypothetical protein [Desulfobacula sp.]MBT4197104.1 hypothetical protein [Desulfobacula sp.]
MPPPYQAQITRHKNPAVVDLSLTINPGETIGINVNLPDPERVMASYPE